MTSPLMQRTLDMIDIKTVQGIYEDQKRCARKYLRNQLVVLDARSMRIIGRWARQEKRRIALAEVA